MYTVNIKQFKAILNFVTTVKKEKGVNIPLFVWGPGGIGKTAIPMQLAKENGIKCTALYLANQTPEELLGQPDGKGGYHPLTWLTPESDTRQTIYFLDEMNRAPKYVTQSMFSFINEGRIHMQTIKPYDVVIAAGNPPDENYDVNVFDDAAFNSRFCHIILKPEIDEVNTYFKSLNLHPAIVTTFLENGCNFKCDEPVKVVPTNRMFERCGHVINAFYEEDPKTKVKVLNKEKFKFIGEAIIAGMIGKELTSIVVKKLKDELNLPTLEEILAGNIDFKSLNDQKKTPIEHITLMSSKIVTWLSEHITNNTLKDINDDQKKNLKLYLNSIPRDCGITFIRETKLKLNSDKDLVGKFSDFFFHLDQKLLTELLNVQTITK